MHFTEGIKSASYEPQFLKAFSHLLQRWIISDLHTCCSVPCKQPNPWTFYTTFIKKPWRAGFSGCWHGTYLWCSSPGTDPILPDCLLLPQKRFLTAATWVQEQLSEVAQVDSCLMRALVGSQGVKEKLMYTQVHVGRDLISCGTGLKDIRVWEKMRASHPYGEAALLPEEPWEAFGFSTSPSARGLLCLAEN